LHSKAAVDLDLTFIVDPGDAEYNLPLGLAEPLNQCIISVIGMFRNHAAKAFQHFAYGLMELFLASISAQNFGEDRLKFLVYCRQFMTLGM